MTQNKFAKIIRWEALTALAIIVFLLIFYVVFLLEPHIKWVAERSAFESIGAEVNIDNVDVDFGDPSVTINRIQFTNPDQPEENSLEISKIKIDFLYKPLLKAAFVSESTKVLGLKFHTQRSFPGRVLPKEKRLVVLKDPSRAKIHDALKGKFKKTAFSDLADLFRKDKRKEIENQYKKKLSTLRVSEEIESQTKSIERKTKALEAKIQSPEVKTLLREVKDFRFESGSTQESLDSASKALALIAKLKDKRKEIKAEFGNLKTEIKNLKNDVKNAPSKFLQDSNMLRASLDPKNLSAQRISEEVLSEYFSLHLSQVDRVTSSLKKQALGDKAKYITTDALPTPSEDTEPATSQISMEKAKEEIFKKYGKNYVFYRPAVLPKYWFKKIKITSKASEGQDFGDVDGVITDFSASPELIRDPIVIRITGSVPKQGIGSFRIDSTVDHRLVHSKTEKVKVEVTDYIIKGLELFDGTDEWIKILQSNASTVLSMVLNGDQIDLNLSQKLGKPEYEVFAKDEAVESLMNRLKLSKTDLSLSLKAKGDVSKPRLSISSNIGDILLRVIKEELKAKAGALVQKGLESLNSSAAKKLAPYLQNLDSASLNAEKLEKSMSQEIEKSLEKLKSKNKEKSRDIKKKLLKKLFNKL